MRSFRDQGVAKAARVRRHESASRVGPARLGSRRRTNAGRRCMSELDRLTHLARAGRLSRRQFLDGAAALGVGAAAAASLLGRAGYAQTPQKGGDLVLGIDSAGATDSLDP